MPATKSKGSKITKTAGKPLFAANTDRPRSATSDAVSKPNLKKE